MSTRRQRWTCRPRRGVAHLVKFLIEDIDYSIFDRKHPMYRRLTRPERQDLAALMRYITEQGEREGIRTPDLIAMRDAERKEKDTNQPRLFNSEDQ